MTSIIESISNGHWFLWIAILSSILCLIFLKGRRKVFVIPAVLMGVILANPLFQRLWENKLGQSYYWRVLWIVPIIPLCAVLPALISEKVKNSYLKGGIAIVCCLIFALTGTFVYSQSYGNFEIPAPNSSKLPKDAVDVSDYLLSIDDHPYVVADKELSIYMRQYDGNIRLMFSRDIDGYIKKASAEVQSVYNELSHPEGDLSVVAEAMLNDGYSYLVTNDQDEVRRQQLSENGFELLDHVSSYGVYKVHGQPTQVKERNDLGQVVSVTFVDEAGNPVNGEDGYATVSYQYDRDGNIVREFRTDSEGNGVANSSGLAGYERKYNGQYRLVMERFLGPDGEASPKKYSDYAEYRREYSGSDIIKESYYDETGELVNRTDIGYAYKTMQYDHNHHVLKEQYYDREGHPIRSTAGYASVRRIYKDNELQKESYYDEDGNLLMIGKGYACFERTYDDRGNRLTEVFLNEAEEPVDQINGYALEKRVYDDYNNLISQQYYDSQGRETVIYTGYSEIRKTYDELGRVMKEEYFISGVPAVQPAGHVAIANSYDRKDQLISRTYLGIDGNPIRRVDGYTEVQWNMSEDGTTRNVSFYAEDGSSVPMESLNLVQDVLVGPEGWSEWMVPKENAENSTFNIGVANLGEKQAGDLYTCQIEIEFSGVTATEGQTFGFWTQGAQDGKWDKGNVWDNNLIKLSEVPEDGIYRFTCTRELNEKMASVSTFSIGFRCDYWKSGAFRVRNVKIEKGDTASEWTPGE